MQTTQKEAQKSKNIERVFSYLRVSTKMQKIDMQRKSIEEFLKTHPNVNVVKEFIDESYSGALGWERPAFKEMMTQIDDVDGIIIYNWDRLSREEEFAVYLMYSLRRKNKFIYISSTREKLNFDELSIRLKTFVDAAFSERERKRIKQRQMDGIKAYIEKYGRWGPRKKYGIALTGARISEKRFWKLYEQYRKAGISKAGIARILNISRYTLYKRLNEKPKKYQEIEKKVSKTMEKD